MTLPSADAPIATEVRQIVIILTDELAHDEQPARRTANYRLEVVDQDGNRFPYRHDTGNLFLHIDTTWRQTLQDFGDYVRGIAEQILPP
jgi:hypothetical protein